MWGVGEFGDGGGCGVWEGCDTWEAGEDVGGGMVGTSEDVTEFLSTNYFAPLEQM